MGAGGAGGALTGSRTPKSLISNLCGLQLSVALPSLVMQSFPGFFSISTGSSRRDLSGLIQNFSKMSPSTHLRRERSSDSCMTRLVQVSQNPPRSSNSENAPLGHTLVLLQRQLLLLPYWQHRQRSIPCKRCRHIMGDLRRRTSSGWRAWAATFCRGCLSDGHVAFPFFHHCFGDGVSSTAAA